MPYGQIIELMVALILLESAPETSNQHFGVTVLILLLFIFKIVAWFFFCRWNGNRFNVGKGAVKPEALEWLALVPLTVDFYLLDIGALLTPVARYIHIPSLVDIIGLFVFIFYLAIAWQAFGRKAGKAVQYRLALRRASLLLPVLLPYVIITMALDILVQLPVPGLHSLFTGPNASLYIFFVLIIFFLFFLPGLVKILWKCRPLPASGLRQRIEEGLERQGIGFSDILIWPAGEAMACTAAVIGIVPGFRYVLLTPCLIQNLLPEEIEAVIAHEAEHVRRKHLVWYIVFLASYSLVLFRLTDPLLSFVMSHPSTLKYLMEMDSLPKSLSALMVAAFLGLLTFLFFRFVFGYFMRNFERQADMAVFRVQGNPFALISALRKVALLSDMDPARPNWHHFSIEERINFLEEAFHDRSVLRHHERRLFFSKGVFVFLFMVLVLLPSFLPIESWQHKARVNSAIFVYNQFIKQNRKDPDWLAQAGSIFFENKMYHLAEKAYKGALKIDPDNPDVMNNLAWLYIKAGDKRFYHPRQALLLAMSAAGQKPESYILDTLAECLYANGYVKRAIETEKLALKRAKKNKDYYRRQLMRFVAECKRQKVKKFNKDR